MTEAGAGLTCGNAETDAACPAKGDGLKKLCRPRRAGKQISTAIPHHQLRPLASRLYCLVLLHTRSVHEHFHTVTPKSVLLPLFPLARKPPILLSWWVSEIEPQVPERTYSPYNTVRLSQKLV